MRIDHVLQRAVLEQLDFDPSIDSSRIGVAVRESVVTLSGHVPSLAEKVRAESVAGQVHGVKAVVDAIKVELADRCETSDETVARLAYDRLASNTMVPLDRIRLSVEGGVVTLRGSVDWQYQREAALTDLRQLNCVRDIRNEIVIKPPVAAEAANRRIHDAMERLGFPGTSNIVVGAHGSDIELTGTVGSWHEKRLAESLAWSIPGVSGVENRLAVT